jgi:hypothetical protein
MEMVKRKGTFLGSTVLAPKEKWPANFHPDAEEWGAGVWVCEHCNGSGESPVSSNVGNAVTEKRSKG